MRRPPILPTLIVALAVATMIWLGVWQLADRFPKKQAYLAQLAANPAKAPVAFPTEPDERLLFRRTSIMCLPPVIIRRAGAGRAGFRLIATCGIGANGSGIQVQLGTTREPNRAFTWNGGKVSGYVGHAPDPRPLIAGLFDHTPAPLMVVANVPPPGLAANAPPDLSSVPNNHLAYAVQWFLFAAVALVIYVLALRRRAG